MRKEKKKGNWYKRKYIEKEEQEQESPSKYMKTNMRAALPLCPGRRLKKSKKKVENKDGVTSVIFIPHTVDSSLAKILKDKANRLKEVTGNIMKIIEKGGSKLEDVLTRNNSWK